MTSHSRRDRILVEKNKIIKADKNSNPGETQREHIIDFYVSVATCFVLVADDYYGYVQ